MSCPLDPFQTIWVSNYHIYIIVIIDTFTRYVELFPKQDVTTIAAADDLWHHTCRFTAPLEIVTDSGTQFDDEPITSAF